MENSLVILDRIITMTKIICDAQCTNENKEKQVMILKNQMIQHYFITSLKETLKDHKRSSDIFEEINKKCNTILNEDIHDFIMIKMCDLLISYITLLYSQLTDENVVLFNLNRLKNLDKKIINKISREIYFQKIYELETHKRTSEDELIMRLLLNYFRRNNLY
jgi:hypothetical protein